MLSAQEEAKDYATWGEYYIQRVMDLPDEEEEENGLENLCEEEEMSLGNFYADLDNKQPQLRKYSTMSQGGTAGTKIGSAEESSQMSI